MVCPAQAMHLSCSNTNNVSKWTGMTFHKTHVPRSYIGCVKRISEPMVRLVQVMYLSCTDTNTISKQTKTRFHLSLVT